MADNISLVVSDIDGTIITSNHEVTDMTRAAAARLRESGIKLALASARPARGVRPIAEALGIDSQVAAFNGALVVAHTGEILARSIIPTEATLRIKAIADELGIGLWLYDEAEWYAERRDAFVDREEHTCGFAPVMDGYEARLHAELNKLTVVGKPELVAVAEKRVLAELAGAVSASRSKPRFLDVTAHGIHKGAAVVRLAELSGVSPSAVAVIGDGPNDVEMFKKAGISIAMGQAVDEVIEAADYITSSNDNEGWSRGIQKYVLKSA